jgi:NAD(P)-dependent dehydrogenase (short-subunit alcohol dehydrogenase family)
MPSAVSRSLKKRRCRIVPVAARLARAPILAGRAERLAEPEEIAAAIAFLVSPDAAYLSGATLAADGGWM